MLYRRNGLPALHPKPRKDRGQLRAIANETAALIERLKRENPSRTGTALLNQLALTDGNPKQAAVSPSTVYRFLRSRGLTWRKSLKRIERQLLLDKAAATSHKKYEAERANQIWQSDMLFGPWVERPGGGMLVDGLPQAAQKPILPLRPFVGPLECLLGRRGKQHEQAGRIFRPAIKYQGVWQWL